MSAAVPLPNVSTAIKLASPVVHVQEATGPAGAAEDMQAAAMLAKDDPDVTMWLDAFDPALLPVKRLPVKR